MGRVDGKLTSNTQTDNYYYNPEINQVTSDAKTMDNNLKLFWSKKLRLNDVYSERQKILERIDNNLKTSNLEEFDIQIKKWKLLDYYVASSFDRERGFDHDGWDKGKRRIGESRYFSKTVNYFSSTLVILLRDLETQYKSVPYWQFKLKVDKFVQILMLRNFMGL